MNRLLLLSLLLSLNFNAFAVPDEEGDSCVDKKTGKAILCPETERVKPYDSGSEDEEDTSVSNQERSSGKELASKPSLKTKSNSVKSK